MKRDSEKQVYQNVRSGKKRIKNFSSNSLNENTIDFIHSKKEEYFENYLRKPIQPRKDVTEIVQVCVQNNIKLGFITTTSIKTLQDRLMK